MSKAVLRLREAIALTQFLTCANGVPADSLRDPRDTEVFEIHFINVDPLTSFVVTPTLR